MKKYTFITGWLAMLVTLNAGAQKAADRNDAGTSSRTNSDAVVWQFGAPTVRTNRFNPSLPTNLPAPVADKFTSGTNQQVAGVNQTNSATNQPAAPGRLSLPAGTNGFVAVAPDAVLWQYGQPTSRSNKFNPALPTNPPPAVPDKFASGTNQSAGTTNQTTPKNKGSETLGTLSPASGTNSEPVWQFGAPTARTNKFKPLLPTNLPPAVTNEK
jgi:hypothetical protein